MPKGYYNHKSEGREEKTPQERRYEMKDTDSLSIARVLYPKLCKMVKGFEQVVLDTLRERLISEGTYKVLPRLEGYLSAYDVCRVHRMVDIIVEKYRCRVMEGLLLFVINRRPIELPELDLEEFYQVMAKTLRKPNKD